MPCRMSLGGDFCVLFFMRICRPASAWRDGSQVRELEHLFPLRMHGRYGLAAGTAGFPSHSIGRITWSNLVEAEDDLVGQYF